jgi:hypothetical protein
MTTAEKISRGFHRLGLFLAALILLIGVPYSLFQALELMDYDVQHDEALKCAHDLLQRDPKRFWDLNFIKPEDLNHVTDDWPVDLSTFGCSDPEGGMVTFGEVRVVPPVNWISRFGSLWLGLPARIYGLGALLLALAIYALVRAIGWIIGGFVGP